MPVRHFLEIHTAEELAELQALESLDPLPDYWLGVGQQCATVYNVHRTKKTKPLYAADFWPWLKRPPKKQSKKDIIRSIKKIHAWGERQRKEQNG